ncbi:MAG: hypothetical protein F9K24_10975 [Leptonema illini]|uniref:Uncharacterized protein n=1 Tax=Leptonema illini TaxID=183 RepID=A0A833LX22_9LEPT|nr:MAG: hypothetical protein F9K24_10975 [Leptonema illini]
MKRFLPLLLIFVSPHLFAGQECMLGDQSEADSRAEWTQCKDGFSGALIITPDSDWEERWNTSPETIPHFTMASTVSYGQNLTVLIFFANPQADPAGKIDIACDIKVTRPDGSSSINARGVACATGQLQGAPSNIRLSAPVIRYVGEQKDLPGIWTIEVTLIDRVRNARILLKSSFELVK